MTDIDPVTLQVLWSRLVSVCNEQAAALIRASFSTVVRESGDLSAGLFDSDGNMIAQADTGTPGHINSMATSMRHFLREIPPTELVDGDVLITNDPWFTCGQLNDLTVVTPIFRRERLVGFVGNTCHAVDIGGRGLSADAREVFEEGLYIPIMKLRSAGRMNKDLERIVSSNVRVPDIVLGDLRAQVACNDVAAQRLLKTIDEFGLEDIADVSREILGRSERSMHAAIDRLPDGRYESESSSDGFLDGDEIRIRCAVTVDGSRLDVDYTGTSDESNRGINVVLNYAAAYTNFCVKAALNPRVPTNVGAFWPISTRAPEGSILNPRRPAAVAGRHVVGHLLPNTILGALEKAVPGGVMAEGAAAIWITQASGRDRAGKAFSFALFSCGGMGARPGKDGLGNTGFPSGVSGVPAEVVETASPLVMFRREIRPDSGGAGRWRGGVGQTLELGTRSGREWTVAVLCDRLRVPPRGYGGGRDGALGRFSNGSRLNHDPKRQQFLLEDDHIVLSLPGGGGLGDAFQRDAEAVLEDVIAGRVSPDAAKAHYGVVVDARRNGPIHLAEDFRINRSRTEDIRAAHKPEQGDLAT
jgi:N-methylhydantoinase B